MRSSAPGKLKIDSDGGERFIVWPSLGSRTAEERKRSEGREVK